MFRKLLIQTKHIDGERKRTERSASTRQKDSFSKQHGELEAQGGTHSDTPPNHRIPVLNENRYSKLPKINPSLKQLQVLQGEIEVPAEHNAHVVRIFTSSTFTDTKYERNTLMEKIYPRLKEYCQQYGYQFQAVDMRWGIRDEASNDQMTTDICMKELRACQHLSTGPNFITFLSNKYGYQPIPRTIEAEEFENLLSQVNETSTKLLHRWYIRDDNLVPAAYVLQPISTNLPDFINKADDKAFKAAKKTWYAEHDAMQQALARAANSLYDDPAVYDKYQRSVTETEIALGILQAEKPLSQCFWFRREIPNIETQEKTSILTKFRDCYDDPQAEKHAWDRLNALKTEKLPKVLLSDNIRQYTVPWTSDGIDPEKHLKHAEYIDTLCEDFERVMINMIDRGIAERMVNMERNPLIAEVLQHTQFCQDKIKAFFGRKDTIQKLQDYICGEVQQPFVVHGQSGCGKTSLMAMVAKLVRQWLKPTQKPVVLLRFIGTTPESSNIRTTLTSLIKQMLPTYLPKLPTSFEMETDKLMEFFKMVIKKPDANQPLVILLDSLDQFDEEGGARELTWLPTTLPPNVKLKVSTLPDVKYQCFPALQKLLPDECQYLGVPSLSESDVGGILETWLDLDNKALTEGQIEVIQNAFKLCPLPLFLKLCYEQAKLWTSYMPISDAMLMGDVRQMITVLFERMEVVHGKKLVAGVLGYMTLSRNGLSENELEDILSCDDDVLNDVFQYWEPSLRRLPPMLLVRLKSDLQQYLVDRGVDGVQVMYWYHRQFIEAAESRYCQGDDSTQLTTQLHTKTKLHKNIADYFLGRWANGMKLPYKDKKGNTWAKDRYVANQPLQFKTLYNMRKLMELPRHLTGAGELKTLKRLVLCNIGWLVAKLSATSVRAVLDDFELAMKHFGEDEDLTAVSGAIQLSMRALSRDPKQLPSQLHCRITQGAESVKKQCESAPFPVLLPSDVEILTKSGGQLKHVLSEHRDDIQGFDLSQDGTKAVTASYDQVVKVWDIVNAKVTRSYEKVDEDPEQVEFCCEDEYVLICGNTLWLMNADTGVKLAIPRDACAPVCLYDNKTKLAVMWWKDKLVRLHSLPDGNAIKDVPYPYLDKVTEDTDYSDYFDTDGRFIIMGEDFLPRIVVLDTEAGEFVRMIDCLPDMMRCNEEKLELEPDEKMEEQFSIRSILVVPDGLHVLVETIQEGRIHTYNHQTGEWVRQFKFQQSISTNHKNVCFINDKKECLFVAKSFVAAVEWETGACRTLAEHPQSLNTRCVPRSADDLKTLVTIGGDDQLRIWDLTRTAGPSQNRAADTGDDAKLKFSSVSKIHWIPGNKRYIVLEASVKSQKYLMTFDLQDRCYVRQTKIPKANHITLLDEHRLVIAHNRKLKLFNLATHEESVSFQGLLNTYFWDFGVTFDKTGIVTVTQSRRDLKVLSVETGKAVTIIKTGFKSKISDFLVSEYDDNVIVWEDDVDNAIEVYSTSSGEQRHIVRTGHDKLQFYHSVQSLLWHEGCAYYITDISGEHQHLGLHLNERGPGEVASKKKMETAAAIAVVNITTGQIKHMLLDKQRVKTAKDCEKTNVYYMCLFNDLIVASYEDRCVRVWNPITGEMLKRLEAFHSSGAELLPLKHQGSSPLFYTYSSDANDNIIQLWNTDTWTCVASLTLEDRVKNPLPVCGGHELLMWASERHMPLSLHLYNYTGYPKPEHMDEPLLMFNEVVGEITDWDEVKSEVRDADDLDQEEAEKSDSDEDDEDDQDDDDFKLSENSTDGSDDDD